MSLFSLLNFSPFRSRKPARRSKTGHKTTRRLVIDSLEKREMLSVTALTNDILLADLTGMGISATSTPMLSGQSVAVSNSGDIVAAWQMNELGDPNIYARYLTDQVERLVLPVQAFEAGPGAQLGLRLIVAGTTVTTTVTLGTVTQTSYNETTIEAALGAANIDVKQVTGYSEPTGQSTLAEGMFDVQYVGSYGKRDLTRTGPDNRPLTALTVTSLIDARGVDWTRGADGVLGTLDDPTVKLTKTSSPVFRVNAPEAPDLVSGASTAVPQSVPSVAVDADGDFVITWQGQVPDSVNAGSGTDVFARRFSPVAYNASPESLGAADQPYRSTRLSSGSVIGVLGGNMVVDATSLGNVQIGDRVDVYWATSTAQANGLRQQTTVGAISGTTVTLTGGFGSDVPAVGTNVQLMVYKWAWGVRALGSDFRVNTVTANPQGEPNVAMDDNGNFVVAWSATGQDYSYFNGIRAQRFNRDGQRVGNEFLVNTSSLAANFNPYVTMASDGIFAVVWCSNTVGQGVLAKIYDFKATSTPADPTAGERPLYNQFIVDAAGGNSQLPAGVVYTSNPSAAFDYAHNLVVSWNEMRNTDNVGPRGAAPNYPGASDVIAKRYRVDVPVPSGVTTPTETRSRFRVNSYNADPNSATTWAFDQRDSQVGVDADGDFIITYDGYGPDVNAYDSLTAPSGEANGALYTTVGASGVASSDNVANTTRDGQDEVYTVTVDGRTTGGNVSLQLRSYDLQGPDPTLSTPGDILTIPIAQRTLGTFPTYDREATRANIDNALQNAQRDGLQPTTVEGTFRITDTTETATPDIYWLNFYGTNIKGTYRLVLEGVRSLPNGGITNQLYFNYTDLETTRLALETELERVCQAQWPGANVTVAINNPPLAVPNPPVTPGGAVSYQFAVSFGGGENLTDATVTGMAGQHNIRGIWQDLTYPADSAKTFDIDAVQVRAASLTNEVQTLNFFGSPDMSGNVKLRLGHQTEVQTIAFGSETQLLAFPSQPSGGAYRLTFYDPVTGAGATTRFLDFDAKASDVASALNALTTVRNNNGTVYVTNVLDASGQPIPYQFLVTFQGDLRDGNQVALYADVSTLVPATTPLITDTARTVGITRAGSTAYVSLTGHSFSVGNLITISGATQPEYNGTFAITTVVNANMFTYIVTGTPATTATGAITATLDGVQRGTGLNEIQTMAWAAETQRIQFLGTPTGGNWTISFNSATTAPLGFGATPAQVAAALNAISTIGGAVGGSVAVTGTAGSSYYVTFGANLVDDDVPAMSVNTSLLTPVTAATVSEVVKGGGPQSGSWSITFGGAQTAQLAWNATAVQVQAALNALGTIGGIGGSVYVDRPYLTYYRVTFLKNLGFRDVALMTANTGGLLPARSAGEQFVQTVQGEIAGPQPQPTGGQWTLSFKGFTTSSLNSNASFLEVQAALEALPSIGAGQVNVVQGVNSRTFTVTFAGALALSDQPPLVANKGTLFPNIPPAIVETTMGSPVVNVAFNATDLNATAINLQTALAGMRPGYTGVTVSRQTVPSTWPSPQPTYQFVVNYGGNSAGIDVAALEQATDSFTTDASQVADWAAEEHSLRIYTPSAPAADEPPGQITLKVVDENGNATYSAPVDFLWNSTSGTAANIQAALRAAPFNGGQGYAGVVVTAKQPTQSARYEFGIQFLGVSAGVRVPTVTIDQSPASFSFSAVTQTGGVTGTAETQYLRVYAPGPVYGTSQLSVGALTSTSFTFDGANLTSTASAMQTRLVALGFTGATVTSMSPTSGARYQFNISIPNAGDVAPVQLAAVPSSMTIVANVEQAVRAETQLLTIADLTEQDGIFSFKIGSAHSGPINLNTTNLANTALAIQGALKNMGYYSTAYPNGPLVTRQESPAGSYIFQIQFVTNPGTDINNILQDGAPTGGVTAVSSTESVKGEPEKQVVNFFGDVSMKGWFTLLLGVDTVPDPDVPIESGSIYFDPTNLVQTALNIQNAIEAMPGEPLKPGYAGVQVASLGAYDAVNGKYMFRVTFSGASGAQDVPSILQGSTPATFTGQDSQEVAKGVVGVAETQLIDFFGAAGAAGFFSLSMGGNPSQKIYFDPADLTNTAHGPGFSIQNAIQALGYAGATVSVVGTPSNPSANYEFSVQFSAASGNVPLIMQATVPASFTSWVDQEVTQGQTETQHLNFYGPGSMNGTFTLVSDGQTTAPMYFDSTAGQLQMAEQIQYELGRISSTETQSFDFGAETQQIAFSTVPTGGDWTISFDPDGGGALPRVTTGVLRYNASASEVEYALSLLTYVGANRVAVRNALDASGNRITNRYLVTFVNTMADQDQTMLAVDATRIIGATASVTEVAKGFATPTVGTFTLSFDPDGPGPIAPLVTAPLTPGAQTASDVENALNAILASRGGSVTVTAGTTPKSFNVTFGGSLAKGDQSTLVIADPFLSANQIPVVMSQFDGVTVVSQTPTSPPSTLPTYQFLVTYGGVARQLDVPLLRAGTQPIYSTQTQGANGAKVSETQHLNFYGPVVPYSAGSVALNIGASGTFNILLNGASTDSVCQSIWGLDALGNPITGIPFQGYNQTTANNIQAALERLSNFAYNGVQVRWQTVTTPPSSPNLTPEGQFLITYDGRSSGQNIAEIVRGGVPASFSLDGNWFQMGGTTTTYTIMFVGEAHDRRFTLEATSAAVTSVPLTEEQIIQIPSSREGYFAIGLAGVAGKSPDIFFDPRDPWTTAQNIQNALRGLLPGNIWVRWVDGTAYNFRVSFGGTLAGTNQPAIQWRQPDHVFDASNPSDDPNLSPFGVSDNQPAGGPIFAATTVPGLAETQRGFRGVSQTSVSLGMTPSGDYVTAWVQWDADLNNGRKSASDAEGAYTTATEYATGIYYRRFDESTDTAGPLVTDILAADGTRLADNAQLTAAPNYLLVTFDEEMLTAAGDLSAVTNPANWSLLRNGTTVSNGISHIEFGMNRSVDLGIRPMGSNKYEAVLYLDGDATAPGDQPLLDGNYQLVANSTLRDRAGNPLGRTGVVPNGASFSRTFSVLVAGSTEMRVNPDPTGLQPTSPTEPQSPRQVASDAEGNFVTVYTGDQAFPGYEVRGVYARVYGVENRPYTGTRDIYIASAPVAGDPVSVSDNPNWQYANPVVARDADGDFVVAWAAMDPTRAAQSWDIYYRMYTADGLPKTGVLLANSTTDNVQNWPSIAMDTDGDFVIVWQSLNQDGSGYGVYGQRFAPNGGTIGGTNEAQMLTFAGNPTGGSFQLTWNGLTTAPIVFDGNTFNAEAGIEQAMLAIGAEVTASAMSKTEVLVRFTGSQGSKNQPQMTVAETLLPDAATISVRTVTEGSRGEFQVNDFKANDQKWPDVAMAAAGNFVVTWTSYGQNGDAAWESNVYAKTFASNNIYRQAAAEMQTSVLPVWDDGRTMATTIVTVDSPANHLVNPGAGYDGAVALTAFRSDGTAGGSGVLLTTGRHILTAAHVVCNDVGKMVTDNIDVTFNLTSGPTTIRSSQITVLPGYTGVPWTGGHDLAIITLPTAAPTAAQRFDIYRATDEMDRTFLKVGYGLSGQGPTGSVPGTYGTKRSAQNRYEATGATLGLYDDALVYDFDNGLAANDAMGVLYGKPNLGLGNAEGDAAPGDSGGPNFFGNLVAGITSYIMAIPGPDLVPGLNSSFGELAGDVRVSTYAAWIDQVTIGGGTEFPVNTTITNNQKWSSVAMDSDGDFVVTWTSYNQDGVGTGYGGGNLGQEGVFAQRFDNKAARVRSEFKVNTFSDKQQEWPRVSMDADGDFVVTWESFQDKPLPPYNDPTVQPDVPNSFGIYAQRFASTSKLGSSSFLGADGQVGGEFAVSVSKDGDQRFPSVALDGTGDFVVAWSGNGTQVNHSDDQGVFIRRFDESTDSAGPIVTDVLNNTAAGQVQIFNNSTIRVPDEPPPHTVVNSMTVVFSEDLIATIDGPDSILNLKNWQISAGTRVIENGVVAVAPATAPAGKVAYQIWLADDVWVADNAATPENETITPNFIGLDPGRYTLSILPAVTDLSANSLDGDYDGRPGGKYNLTFSILDPGQPPKPTESPINTTITGNQNDPAIACNSQGDFVVVWVSYGQAGDVATDGNIVGQRFDRFGTKQGNEFIVNSYTPGSQVQPDVAMDAFGNFTVAWWGPGYMDSTNTTIDDQGIFARRYDAFGTPLEASQFRVNTTFINKQCMPAIGMDSSGNSVITWTSYGQAADIDGIYAQRFDTQGAPAGGEFLVNTYTTGSQDRSDVAMDALGNFVVVWNSDMQDGYQWGVYGKRYNAIGQVQGAEFRVNIQGNGNQVMPVVAMDQDGDYVVAWSSDMPAADPSGSGVYLRRYSKTGAALSDEVLVNQWTASNQSAPALDMAANGDFTIAWVSRGQDNPFAIDDGVYASRYAADGTRVASEFLVNETVTGDQNAPAIAVDTDGDFYMCWVGPDASGTGIWGWVGQVNPTSVFAAGDMSYEAYMNAGAPETPGPTQPVGLGMTTPGLLDPSTSWFYLRDSNSTGLATYSFGYGVPGSTWIPIMGDWDGDGDQTIGFFDPATSLFYLRNSNTSGYADLNFAFGAPGQGWLPLVGDWNGDGIETIGLFDPVNSMFYLTNGHATGYADISFGYGAPNSGWKPLMGDWDGNGIDTLGFYDPATSYFMLRNSNSTGFADYTFGYGGSYSGWTPIVGDWNKDGRDTIGFYDATSSAFMLRNTNSGGFADVSFGYGAPGQGWLPLVGQWNSPYHLMADGGTVMADAPAVAQQDLSPIVAEALARWSAAGLDDASMAKIAHAQVIVTDLPGDQLGMAIDNLVYVDRDAAGRGWFVDQTPQRDEEFTVRDGRMAAIDAAAVDRIDLLSVVAHELGHSAGLGDLDGAMEDVMGAMLSNGVRRMPGVLASDAIFGEGGLEG